MLGRLNVPASASTITRKTILVILIYGRCVMKKSHRETIKVWENKVKKIKKAKKIKLRGTRGNLGNWIFSLDTGDVLKFGKDHCPLCQEYDCTILKKCPISKFLNKLHGCDFSPYWKVFQSLSRVCDGYNPIRTLEKAMIKELEFLKEVLREENNV
jgi:hypothetical protein